MAKRGNPNWGKPDLAPATPTTTAFESMVKSLRLPPEQYTTSNVLRDWVRKNKEHRYVPAALLEAFGFEPSSEV